jgi:branched-subunit amino acid transport protein
LSRAVSFSFQAKMGLPDWAQRGLQYAPIAAMAAVVLPEILLQQGQFLQTGWMRDGWALLWVQPFTFGAAMCC